MCIKTEVSGIGWELVHVPWVGSPTAPFSMPSITKSMTPSMAPTSTRFRSLARMLALAFLVPKVSPRASLASRNCEAVGAGAGGMDFRAFTVRVKIYGDFAIGRMFKVDVRRLCTATTYLVVDQPDHSCTKMRNRLTDIPHQLRVDSLPQLR